MAQARKTAAPKRVGRLHRSPSVGRSVGKDKQAVVPRKLLDALVGFFAPRKIILFGSAARGKAGPDSDLDLVVILDDDCPAEKLSWRALGEARRGYHDPVDIIACRESVFQERKDIIGSLAHIATNEGVVVYERP
ncbi:MAG: nucleotidyltransferase domain-containing protein [Alphaproteobacteria bacterium]|nr:nucleotidyltransferase domain-containing protein [Alphaproteobacteria bacterium]